MSASFFTLPLREGRSGEAEGEAGSGRGPAVSSATYPSPKFGRIAALRSTNFDPPSRGGWSSSCLPTGELL